MMGTTMKRAPSHEAHDRLMARACTRDALAYASRLRAALVDPLATEVRRAEHAWHHAILFVHYRELASRYRRNAQAARASSRAA